MKESYYLKVKLNPEMAKKLSIISYKEGLTAERMIVQLVHQRIAYYEKTKDRISNLNEADMTEFEKNT